MKKQISKLSNQSGVVLIVSLFMLLLITLIGLSGMQSTALEEKMASNNRDQNIAFQAAEAALRAGEQFINTNNIGIFTTNPINANGLHLESENLNYKSAATWGNSESAVFPGTIPLVAAQPRYYIEYLSAADFRVTARGTGRQSTSQVFLRSYYRK